MASVGSRPAASWWRCAAAHASLLALAAAGCGQQEGDAPRARTAPPRLAAEQVVPLSWRSPLFGPPTSPPHLALLPTEPGIEKSLAPSLGPIEEPALEPLPPVDEP